MKKKRENIHDLIREKFGSNILPDERFTSKSYWNAISYDEEGNPQESARANPDILPDTASPWASKLTAGQDDQLDSIDEAWTNLTTRERQAVQLAADGFTLDKIARRLNIKLKGADSLIRRARAKIQKFHRRKSASGGH